MFGWRVVFLEWRVVVFGGESWLQVTSAVDSDRCVVVFEVCVVVFEWCVLVFGVLCRGLRFWCRCFWCGILLFCSVVRRGSLSGVLMFLSGVSRLWIGVFLCLSGVSWFWSGVSSLSQGLSCCSERNIVLQ